MRRRISCAQQTKNWCVGFSFPPPSYAGIRPTLYLFGFQANALNSHFSSYLPGFDPGSGASGGGGLGSGAFGCLRASAELRRLAASKGPGSFQGPLKLLPSGRFREGPGQGASNLVWTSGLVVGFASFGLRLASISICSKPPPVEAGQGHSQDHAQKTQKAKVVGFRVTD